MISIFDGRNVAIHDDVIKLSNAMYDTLNLHVFRQPGEEMGGKGEMLVTSATVSVAISSPVVTINVANNW